MARDLYNYTDFYLSSADGIPPGVFSKIGCGMSLDVYSRYDATFNGVMF